MAMNIRVRKTIPSEIRSTQFIEKQKKNHFVLIRWPRVRVSVPEKPRAPR